MLPPRPLNLGRSGYFCNVLAPILVTVVGITVCFPPQLPVIASNANHTPIVLATLFGVVIGAWYMIGHRFIHWFLRNNVKVP